VRSQESTECINPQSKICDSVSSVVRILTISILMKMPIYDYEKCYDLRNLRHQFGLNIGYKIFILIQVFLENVRTTEFTIFQTLPLPYMHRICKFENLTYLSDHQICSFTSRLIRISLYRFFITNVVTDILS